MIDEYLNILIVEDEYVNAKFVQDTLLLLKQNVISIVSTADEAIEVVKKNTIDLVFMDINIDGVVDGIRCAQLINLYSQIPIIYMTAYGDSLTIEEASDSNIYGYMIKPFDSSDIEANLKVALNMISKIENKLVEHKVSLAEVKLSDTYTYNFKTKTLTIDNMIISFTKKETLLFHLFCLNLNQNISYDLLLEYVWENKPVGYSTIRDTISRLRKKAPFLSISSISGLGYSLSSDL